MDEQRHTCPGRLQTNVQIDRDDLDHWRMDKGYRICSFCESVHPDDFSTILRQRLVSDEYVFINPRHTTLHFWLVDQRALLFRSWHIPEDRAHVAIVQDMSQPFHLSPDVSLVLAEIKEAMRGVPV